ncbi:MAG TPA: prohead protease/major capsid protein fusion protein [Albitalea sp.]|uniref:prohead protease/major capsid protein fusion protein n=1 Tax=Piscinibacter sp. TaxID=1903157 RepID=UPI002ED5472B
MPHGQLTGEDVHTCAPLPLAGRSMELTDFTRASASAGPQSPLATARLVFTTGAPVRRYDYLRDRPYVEQLVVDASAIRMDRLKRGAPLLNTHRGYDLEGQLGVVESPVIANGVGECTVAFSRRPSVAGYVQDVEDRVIRNVSVGYARHRIEMVAPADEGGLWVYRVIDWEPYEISLVPIAADMDSQVRGAGQASAPDDEYQLRTFPCEFIEIRAAAPHTPSVSLNRDPKEMTMPQSEVRTFSSREDENDEIRAIVKRHGLESTFADRLVSRALSFQAAGFEVLDELARRDQGSGGHRNIDNRSLHLNDRPWTAGDELSNDRRDHMVEALACRAWAALTPARENPYRHARIADMARDCLEIRGIRTTGMSASQLIERGLHGTSDFPQLLAATANKVLRTAYEAAPAGVKRVARKSTARDFKAKSRLMLSEAPTLLQVNEHGEFKHGTMSESKGSYGLATYGRIFGITRQALVNDDLDAFGDMAVRFGRAATEFEAQTLVDLLTSNPAMYDAVVLFHATHGNLATGAGSALQETSLTTARTAMRLQKGLDGKTPIDATPKYLIVPAALETTAEKLLASITPATSSNVNPFAGKLELVVEPRLDAVSATAWYLAADSGVIDTLEYAYLEGEEGPQLFTEEGFEVDGMRYKVREDFGAGAIDWRGLYKANGT